MPCSSCVNCVAPSRNAGHVSIVVIADRPSAEDRIAVLAAGADDYIDWPADMDVLRERFDIAERQALCQGTTPAPAQPQLSELFFVLGQDGVIRRATPLVAQFLGYLPDTLVGLDGFSFFDPTESSTDPEHGRRVIYACQRFAATRSPRTA